MTRERGRSEAAPAETVGALGRTMMRQFEYVIREIRRVEEARPAGWS